MMMRPPKKSQDDYQPLKFLALQWNGGMSFLSSMQGKFGRRSITKVAKMVTQNTVRDVIFVYETCGIKHNKPQENEIELEN